MYKALSFAVAVVVVAVVVVAADDVVPVGADVVRCLENPAWTTAYLFGEFWKADAVGMGHANSAETVVVAARAVATFESIQRTLRRGSAGFREVEIDKAERAMLEHPYRVLECQRAESKWKRSQRCLRLQQMMVPLGCCSSSASVQSHSQ